MDSSYAEKYDAGLGAATSPPQIHAARSANVRLQEMVVGKMLKGKMLKYISKAIDMRIYFSTIQQSRRCIAAHNAQVLAQNLPLSRTGADRKERENDNASKTHSNK